MCRILAKTKDMPKEQWLALRKQGIGGSDAGAICGLNPYVSPMDVYVNKTSEFLPEDMDNEAMREGRDLEEYVARRFSEATGLKVRRANVMYASREHPFMLADVDRLVVGKGDGLVGLECKTASPYSADKWKDGAVPAHYLAQCYHYMAVLGASAWYIAVLIYGREFKYVRIERDEDVIRNLVQIERDFWENHVQKNIMPEPDGSEATEQFINSYFSRSRELLSKPLIGFDEKLNRREEIAELLERLTQEKRKIEQEVKTYLDEAEIAENENFFVSWKNSISNRIDAARLKSEMPEVYEEFTKPVQSRRLLIRAV